MNYSEKLKDPRWQKKRLEIMNRDGFKCQSCGDDKSTLHVHHKEYKNGNDPWDYDNDVLITYCETCHKNLDEIDKRVSEDNGYFHPRDFLVHRPVWVEFLRSIGNHEGFWTLEFVPNMYVGAKLFMIRELIDFVGDCDQQFYEKDCDINLFSAALATDFEIYK